MMSNSTGVSPENLIHSLQNSPASDWSQIIQPLDINLEMIQALKDFSSTYYVSNPGKAKEIAQLAYDASRLLPIPTLTLGIWTLANSLVYTGEYSQAVELYQIARSQYLAQDLQLDAARLSVGLVFVLVFTGRSSEALEVAQATEIILSESATRDISDLRRLGNLLMNVGLLHEVVGRYEDALTIYERQTIVASQLGDELLQAQMLHNQACAFMRINALSDAFHSFSSAEKLFQKNEATSDLIRLYANQSELLVGMKQFGSARESITRAQQLAKQTKGTDIQQQWLVLLEAMLELTSQATISHALIERLRRAMEVLKNSGHLYLSGLTAIAIGRCLMCDCAWNEADSVLLISQKLAEETSNRELLFRTFYRRAELHSKQGDDDLAFSFYEAALCLLETIRQELQVETFRSGYLEDKLAIYQDLTRLYLDAGRHEDAFQTIERSRARLLVERMHFRLNVEISNLVVAENSEVHRLASEIRRNLEKLDELYQQQRLRFSEENDEVSSEQANLTSIIVDAEERIQSLSHTLQRFQPLLSPMATGQTIELLEIQTILQDEILIEYFILNEEVLAVIVQQNQPLVFRSIGNLARIERVYQAFAANVERTLQMQSQLGIERIANFMPGLIADANKRLSDLYQCVFAPLADLLPSTASLIISGENLLHYIPFHALYNGTDYLCAQFKISYTPSATLIGLCLKPPKHSQGTLLCGFAGNNLHAIYDEIMALDKILPSVEILLGNEATTDAVLSKISGRQLIHLATHARFRTDNPLLSVLKLADRGLSLAEIARLTLDAELVTLSGCETGYGQMMGSDIVSLAGGFLGCGARSLMVSLWRIEDRVTSDFMVHFYSNLLKGMGRSTALQMAQQALLQLGQDKAHSHYAHPAYWAPFILLGNPRALEMLRIS